jgi:hypothetical protein
LIVIPVMPFAANVAAIYGVAISAQPLNHGCVLVNPKNQKRNRQVRQAGFAQSAVRFGRGGLRDANTATPWQDQARLQVAILLLRQKTTIEHLVKHAERNSIIATIVATIITCTHSRRAIVRGIAFARMTGLNFLRMNPPNDDYEDEMVYNDMRRYKIKRWLRVLGYVALGIFLAYVSVILNVYALRLLFKIGWIP